MLVENGKYQPYDWGRTRSVRDDSPGVHQIRLHNGDGLARIDARKHRHYVSRAALEVACSCGEHLAWIEPGGDCWTPFKDHLRSMNDNH